MESLIFVMQGNGVECCHKNNNNNKTKVTIRTRIPAKWENNDNNFRKQIWDRINKRIIKGKISEDKDGKE